MEAYHAATRRRRTRRLLTACLLVAVVVAAGALLVIRHRAAGGSGTSASPTSGKNANGRDTPGGSTPLTDPSKLTVEQVFPGGRLTADGLTFTMVASQVATPCALAAHGAFAAALTSARCERVIRATFIDSGRKDAVTAGVAVLPSSASARQADIRKQFGPDIWFTGLNGAAGTSAARVSRNGGYGYDAVDGRYIVFAFATFSNGLSPTSHRADLSRLISLSKAFTDSAQRSLAAGVAP
ncbi:MAG TPA: hypothetical protein VGS62_00850 [Streptosporangiaceae bacterium]|nr:hypothetical protein [Streptosporangiaceae bacterium]